MALGNGCDSDSSPEVTRVPCHQQGVVALPISNLVGGHDFLVITLPSRVSRLVSFEHFAPLPTHHRTMASIIGKSKTPEPKFEVLKKFLDFEVCDDLQTPVGLPVCCFAYLTWPGQCSLRRSASTHPNFVLSRHSARVQVPASEL